MYEIRKGFYCGNEKFRTFGAKEIRITINYEMMNTNTPIGKCRENVRFDTGIQLCPRIQVKFVLGSFA